MKLLICASEYYPHGSGIANVAHNVVEQLKKRKVDCKICSPTGPDIKIGSAKLIEKFGIVGILYYWYQVSKFFKYDDFDVVWLHNPLFLKNNPFKRSLVTMHSTYCGYVIQVLSPKIYYKTASKIEKYCLNHINREVEFIGVGTQVCKELEKIGINKERIRYIPNGVDTELFKPLNNKKKARNKIGIPEDDLIILSIGRLTEVKQPFKLIESFSQIKKKIKNVTLVIAGNGDLLEETKKFVKQKKLDNVKFLGYVDNKKSAPNLYACSDYFMITSNYEGGEPTLTVAEAMACGLPCIVSNIQNLRFIESVKSGIIVDFSNNNKATEQIIDFLKGDLSDYGNNAREYAVKNLDWSVLTERYMKEFKKIIDMK